MSTNIRARWLPTALGAALLPLAAASAAAETEAEFVEALLAKMTLEEKFGQLNQPRGRWGETGPQVEEGGEDDIRAGRIGSYLGVHGAAYTRQMQKIAVEESRLGVPLLFAHDVIHGFRTIFPVPLGEAASFDASAIENAARIGAIEATAAGLHWTYAPMVDIARDPRWGRIVEGSGESAFLGSELAAARVRGFQGTDLTAPDTMMATAKHFAAYGAAEGGRDYNVADISERTLHDVYLPPFKAAVVAGVQSVMAGFNEIGGVPMHAHGRLINGVLRGDWGWDGVLVSDYTGVLELIEHGVAADRSRAGVLALEAGVDVDMVSNIYLQDLPAVVRAGGLDAAAVDEAVRRVLRAKYRLGLFEDPYRYSDEVREREHTLRPEYRRAARELARKSLVLLRNQGGVLPLSKRPGTIAVIGPLADDRRVMLGGWAAAGRAEDAVMPLEGIRAAVGAGTRVLHARGAEVEGDDRSGFEEAVRIARQADVVLMFIGEHHDLSAEAHNRTTLDLPGVQEDLVKAVHATGKPVVVVLFNGRPLTIDWLAQNVPAILVAWFPGIEAGHAVADVLFGDYSPAGRLPVTFPRTVGQVPIYHDHKNTGRPPSEQEKYTSKYIDVPWTPLYPFGHGLSYTSFSYSRLKVEKPRIGVGDSLRVEVSVTNTGDRAGDEVVQLYLRDDVGSVTRPVRELRGFQRIHLRPGEKRRVEFVLGPGHLAFHGRDLEPVVEPGTFTVFAGGSSQDLIETKFEVVAHAARGPRNRPRNVIFILSDDHRHDFMGFMPQAPDWLETPALDRMAAGGAHIRNAFVTTSLCSPSRASILTGQYAHRHRIVDNTSPIPKGTLFFPQFLQQAGYRTAYVGKWHMGEVDDDPQPGFDHWVSFRGQGTYRDPMLNVNGKQVQTNGYTTDILADHALDWLRRNGARDGKPFFLYLSHKAVHAEFEAAPRHRGRHAGKPIPIPPTMNPQETAGKPDWVRAQRNSWHGVDFMYHGAMQYEEFFRAYTETLLALDESVGRVLDYLDKSGLAQSTLVIYMGDNGFLLGEHGLIDKRNAYEASMRVPMLAYAPGFITAGSTITPMVRGIDMAPTILELANTQATIAMDGRSILPLLRGEPADWPLEMLYEYYWEHAFPHTPTVFALRDPRYKYIYYHGVWDADELYDLERDPHERSNLIGDPAHQARAEAMKRRLWDLLEETGGMSIPLKRAGPWRADQRRLAQ